MTNKLPDEIELEIQIAATIREVDGSHTMGACALAEHISKTLLSQYVLCSKEPMAWIYYAPGLGGTWNPVLGYGKPHATAHMASPLHTPAFKEKYEH